MIGSSKSKSTHTLREHAEMGIGDLYSLFWGSQKNCF